MTTTTDNEEVIEAKDKIAVAAGAALLAAGFILVMFVLPAEYGIDPVGTGARFGLLELGVTGQQVRALSAAAASGASQAAIIVSQDREFTEETVDFKVGPHEFMEYKYRLAKGEALLYAWNATGRVSYELHAEPDGAPRGYAQSYENHRLVIEKSSNAMTESAFVHTPTLPASLKVLSFASSTGLPS